jgi:predicted DCC family thiol-disulfide oxidoreductase YuxK
MTAASGPDSDTDDRASAGKPDEILLVYDKECPACDTYCRLVDVKPSAGKLTLVDARDPNPVMEEITRAGLDIDQGMVVKMNGRIYYGSDAIHALALVSNRSGFFNKLSHYAFRSKGIAHLLYPPLRACRNLLLKILRKAKINNLRVEGNDRF